MEFVVILAIITIFVFFVIYNFINNYNDYKGSSYYQITHNSYWAIHNDAGIKGEYEIYRNLHELENCGCKLLFNLYIPIENNKFSEIDIVLFHPKGIFVIESKNYSGWIFGDERQTKWTQTLPISYGRTHKEYFYNPIQQNNTHIKNLRKCIDNKVPIYSVIAFSDSCTLKKVTTHSNVIITQYRNILLDIKLKIAEIDKNYLNNTDLDALYNKLYQYSQANDDVKIQHIQNIKSAKSHFGEINYFTYSFKQIKIFLLLVFIVFLVYLLYVDINLSKHIQQQKIVPTTTIQDIEYLPSIKNNSEIDNNDIELLSYEDNDYKTKKIIRKEQRALRKQIKKQIKAEKKQQKEEIKAMKKKIKEEKKASKRQTKFEENDLPEI